MTAAHPNAAPDLRRTVTTPAAPSIDLRVWAARDRQLWIASLLGAIVLWVLAFLNAIGTVAIELRPGEGVGANPALDFVVLGWVVLLLPYGIVRRAHLARIDALERSVPGFLEDVAESGRHGLTLADAIAAGARGHYGALSPEVRRLASEIAWGIPVEEALRGFAGRLPTPLVRTAVAVALRAQATGGRYPDVLERVARDLRATQLRRTERREVLRTYFVVVGLAFAVFLLTVYVLASVFLPEMLTAAASTPSVGPGVLIGGSVAASLFLALFAAVVAHGVGDGLVAGLLYRGRLVDGMAFAAVLLLVGWCVMRFAITPITGGV
ncbi:MAG: type II secretion system F family protein [Thermoplasmata archaeon]